MVRSTLGTSLLQPADLLVRRLKAELVLAPLLARLGSHALELTGGPLDLTKSLRLLPTLALAE